MMSSLEGEKKMNDNRMEVRIVDDDDDDWEEWDGSTPFWHHCVAGSLAGLTEHSCVFPLDTVRTHIQVCAACPNNAASASAQHAAGSLPVSSSSSLCSSAATSAVKSSKTMTTSSSSSSSSSILKQQRAVVASGPRVTALETASRRGMLETIRHLMNEPAVMSIGDGMTSTASRGSSGTAVAMESAVNPPSTRGIARLFRGIQTMFVGCIPAHALYFSSYETIKAHFTEINEVDNSKHLPWYGSMLAGGTASFSHDCIMSPLDTIKQRLQLGHYDGVVQAMRSMVHQEGFMSLYRSFPVTFVTNVPYGMIMVSTNEYLKERWSTNSHRTIFGTEDDVHHHTSAKPSLSTTMMASSIAGFVASACTTPLDRIKTSLQTQKLVPACLPSASPVEVHTVLKHPKMKDCLLDKQQNSAIVVRNWNEACKKILIEEGPVGLFRGIVPRVLSHTPAVAISWTTYETAKQFLSQHFS